MPESTAFPMTASGAKTMTPPTSTSTAAPICPDWLRLLPPGWLGETEALLLCSLAEGRDVLEIGAFQGRSTAALARGARRVVSVDWHRGDDGSGWGWTLPAFSGHLTRLGLWDRVIPVVGRVEDVAPLLAGPFGLVWIDGAHGAADVERDTRLALRLLAPGGVIAWHDWDYESVRAGVAAGGIDPRHCHEPAGTRIGTWTHEV